MVMIRLLKDIQPRKTGDVVSVRKSYADLLISKGVAEYMVKDIDSPPNNKMMTTGRGDTRRKPKVK